MLVSRKPDESEGDFLLVMKFWLIVCGVYIWEFVTTLDFEWSVIRRHQPYRWTLWIYTVSRLSGIAVISTPLINFYNTSPINCQAWITFGWAFGILGGYGLSSLLIVLRIFAIWDKNKVIMAISAAIWVINLGCQIVGVVKIRAEWVPAAKTCAITNVEICREYYIVLLQLLNDVILPSIMLTGLLRLRQGQGSFYIWRLLWKQGVIWFVIANAAQLPLVILVFLDVNDTLSLLFLVPSNVAMIIAATRMYRSLINITSSPDFLGGPDLPPNLQTTKGSASRTKDSSVVHIPSNRRLEVTVHRDFHEEYPMSQTNHYEPYPAGNLDTHFADKLPSPSSSEPSAAAKGDDWP